MIEYQAYFEILLKKNKYEYGFEEFIKATMVKDAWACEINIVSVTILLNRQIWVFNESKNEQSNVITKFVIEINDEQPITIGLTSNHFFPILFQTNHMPISKKSLDYNFLDNIPKLSINLYS